MDLINITKHLNTQKKCVRYLEQKRWNGVPTCPYCQSQRSSPKDLRHNCLDCTNSYSVTIGTLFENSNLALYKWFIAIALILSAKKGISSLQLSRDLSVNKNTAWLLQMKIRKAMSENSTGLLGGIVEADETYVGGRINGHYPQRKQTDKPIRGNAHLTPVLGMIERDGDVIAKVIKGTWREVIMPILRSSIVPESTLVADGHPVYSSAKRHFKDHQTVSHSTNVFAKGEYHTNTIEGFWSQLKRAIVGQYHKIDNKYLQLYVDEICFKYNHRSCSDKGYNNLLCLMIGN